MRPSPAQLRALAGRDPRLGALLRRLPAFPGLPTPRARRATYWESLAQAIVYQQLAGGAAAAIHRRVCALTPGPRLAPPAAFLRLREEALRAAGLSRAKRAALLDLAARLTDGRLRLRAASRLPDAEVVARLVTVRGIGVWSAQMFLMFRLGRPDVMPAGDLGVREGLRLLDHAQQRPPPAQVLERTACWAPLRSVGAWYLWRLVEECRGR